MNRFKKEIVVHYELIREFWVTAGISDNQATAYAGLGDLYVADERYTMIEGKPQPEFAKFMQQAMKYFADRLYYLPTKPRILIIVCGVLIFMGSPCSIKLQPVLFHVQRDKVIDELMRWDENT